MFVQPLDLVKNRMQLSGEGAKTREYRTSFHAVGSILRHEGIRGIYTGYGHRGTYVPGDPALGMARTQMSGAPTLATARTQVSRAPRLGMGRCPGDPGMWGGTHVSGASNAKYSQGTQLSST